MDRCLGSSTRICKLSRSVGFGDFIVLGAASYIHRTFQLIEQSCRRTGGFRKNNQKDQGLPK